jgi:uncharacterized protein YecE (DUF72 family)
MTRFYIGTSGWQYWDWKGRFYPQDIKSQDQFDFYKKKFNTVEINSTFYHFPKESTITKWKEMAGKTFTFAVKVSKTITHIKRLKDIKQDLFAFFERVGMLGSRLGVYLYQLPPSLKFDLTLLNPFLKLLSKEFPHAIEFRHNSWWNKKTYTALSKRGVGLVCVSAPGIKSPFDITTSDIAYFRFHGAKQWYRENYSKEQLQFFAKCIKDAAKNVKRVFVYFDNTFQGAAPADALYLKQILNIK